MGLYTWTLILDGQYQNQIDYVLCKPKMEKLYAVCKNKTGSWLSFKSSAPYWKIQAKLKKVGKTTRPFRYDLNQISYDYTVEVTNRFKGLDLGDKLHAELGTEVWNNAQEAVNKTIPNKEKEMQEGKEDI